MLDRRDLFLVFLGCVADTWPVYSVLVCGQDGTVYESMTASRRDALSLAGDVRKKTM